MPNNFLTNIFTDCNYPIIPKDLISHIFCLHCWIPVCFGIYEVQHLLTFTHSLLILFQYCCSTCCINHYQLLSTAISFSLIYCKLVCPPLHILWCQAAQRKCGVLPMQHIFSSCHGNWKATRTNIWVLYINHETKTIFSLVSMCLRQRGQTEYKKQIKNKKDRNAKGIGV